MMPIDDFPLEGDLRVRAMRADDLPRVLAWRLEPHVRAFWDNDEDPPDIDAAYFEEYYRPLLEGADETTATILEWCGKPVGYLQFYPWSATPEAADELGMAVEGAWGLDLFVGDPQSVGHGIGARAVDAVCRYLFETRAAARVALLTAVENVAAQRAYEKAGFAKVRRADDPDTRGGVRIASWLMVREREGAKAP